MIVTELQVSLPSGLQGPGHPIIVSARSTNQVQSTHRQMPRTMYVCIPCKSHMHMALRWINPGNEDFKSPELIYKHKKRAWRQVFPDCSQPPSSLVWMHRRLTSRSVRINSSP